MAVRVILVLLVLAAVFGGLTWYAMRPRPVEVTAISISSGPVEETVAAMASGTIMPAQQATVAVGAIGTISAVHVKEGDRVTEGQLLVELAHEELDAQVELTRANLRVGESRLAQAKIGVSMSEKVSGTRLGQAAAQLEAARGEYERVKPLAEREAISKSAFEQASLALEVARQAYAAAQASGGETDVRAEDVISAEAMLDQLRAAVTAAEATREKAFLRAPFDGVVAKLLLEKGEAVAMGIPVVHVVRDDELYIEAPFDEASVAQVRVGMPVRIEVDAFDDRTYEGTVSYISPFVAPLEDLARTLQVKVDILTEAEELLPGMSADVTVIAEQKEDVLYAPSESLVRDQYAYVVEDGKAVRREVELGIGNWQYQEVLSGLRAGERLITSVGILGLDDGVPVTVVDSLGF